MKINSKHIESFSTIISIVGLVLVLATISLQFSEKISYPEVAISGLTVAIGALSGIFSKYISRFAIRFPSQKRVFISYSREEKRFAEQLREMFISEGLIVWLDRNDLVPGDDLKATVNAAIESSNAFVTVVSQDPGPSVLMEIRAAVQKHIPIFAVLDREGTLPLEMKQLRNITYTNHKDVKEVTASVIASL